MKKCLAALTLMLIISTGCSMLKEEGSPVEITDLPGVNTPTEITVASEEWFEETRETVETVSALPEASREYPAAETIPPIVRAEPIKSPLENTEAYIVTEEADTAAEVETAAQPAGNIPQVTVVTLPSSAETEQSGETAAPAAAVAESVTEAETEAAAEAVAVQTSRSEVQLSANYPKNDYYALNYARQKAVWVSYLEYARLMANADEKTYTQRLEECFDNISALGCNTVYFHVRAYGDAYYKSSLFPKGDRWQGDYDPLEIAVRLAHDRGLSLHAWVNPMRLMTDSGMKALSEEYPVGKWFRDSTKKGAYLVSCDGRWYLNPAYSETVALICDGIGEILSNYDVDGIQIDDYFYPTTEKYFDSAAYAASGTSLSLAKWRTENVTRMVKMMYRTVHNTNPTAVFGISPQGNINNNINTLYADVYTWTSEEGCCDYICPQIYYGFDNAAQPYVATLEKWVEMVKQPKILLVIGLAAYKSGNSDSWGGAGKNEWQENTDILARQMEVTDIYGIGYAFFRYDSIFNPEPANAKYISAELDNIRKEGK